MEESNAFRPVTRPTQGIVRLAQAAKVFDLVRVETGKANCGTFFSGSWARGLQSAGIGAIWLPPPFPAACLGFTLV